MKSKGSTSAKDGASNRWTALDGCKAPKTADKQKRWANGSQVWRFHHAS